MRALEALWKILQNLQLLTSCQVLLRKLQELTGYESRKYHCYVNKCIAFTGRYSMLDQYPYGEPRYQQPRRNPAAAHSRRARDAIQKPRKQCNYFPLIRRLLLQYANPERSELMQTYVREQPEFTYSQVDQISDCWTGKLYEELRHNGVFSDPRTVSLTFTSNGISLTTHNNHTSFICKTPPIYNGINIDLVLGTCFMVDPRFCLSFVEHYCSYSDYRAYDLRSTTQLLTKHKV